MKFLSVFLLAAVCSSALCEEDEIFENDSSDAYKAVVEVCFVVTLLLTYLLLLPTSS